MKNTNVLVRSRVATAKPAVLRHTDPLEIPDNMSIHQLRQLIKLSRFGFGGCIPLKLTEAQENMWFDFASGNACVMNAKEIAHILAKTMPDAFEAIILHNEDSGAFFRAHNERRYRDLAEVRKAGRTGMTEQLKLREALIMSCLDKVGVVMEIKDRSQVEHPTLANPLLLNSNIGSRLTRIGLVNVTDGKNTTTEHVFLDFVPGVRIGSSVRMHRSIAYSMD